MTARIMNATSNTAEYQFQDVITDAGVLPVNFPRTRDQFNALTGKSPLVHFAWFCPCILTIVDR
jgi:hypothetical protein